MPKGAIKTPAIPRDKSGPVYRRLSPLLFLAVLFSEERCKWQTQPNPSPSLVSQSQLVDLKSGGKDGLVAQDKDCESEEFIHEKNFLLSFISRCL